MSPLAKCQLREANVIDLARFVVSSLKACLVKNIEFTLPFVGREMILWQWVFM